jgi:hypothetical protein
MRPTSRLTLALFFIIVAAALLLFSFEGAEAADKDIIGDWVISGATVTETDSSIDVRGNVTIQSGALLKLYNCTLWINATSNGQFGLEVMSGGRMEAYDTVITGNNARMTVAFYDDVLIEGCSISRIHGASSSLRGLTVDGGTTSIKDTSISDSNYHGLYVLSNLNLDNVTITSAVYSPVYIYNWGGDADYTVSISNSHITCGASASSYRAGVLLYAFQSGVRVDVTVTDTTFSGYRGVYISTTGKGNADIQRCTFIDCRQGLTISSTTSSGDFVFRDNTITAPSLGNAVGITVTYRSNWGPVVEDNVVEDLHTGYKVFGRWGVAQTVSVGNLTVSDCTRGLVTDYNIRLTIHNSSFTNIGGSVECFIARNHSTITLIDTEHPWGSGSVEHVNSWIKASIDLDIRGAKWKDGGNIGEGFLVLENVTQYEVARFNLSNLSSQDVAGWEVNSGGRRTSLYLYPALYMGTHGFRGERIDVRTYTPSVVELVDDYGPSISIEAPVEDEGYPVATIVAKGAYDELGSGLDMIQYSVNGANPVPLTSWTDGAWSLPLVDLVDGEHDLTVWPTDKVGNEGEEVSVAFIVDTIAPIIDVDPYDALVNTTTVVLSGTTEPLASLKVDGVPVIVSVDGTFTVQVELTEGDNVFALDVTDRAGNFNTAQAFIHLDTIPPPLTITSPEETNARWVYAEGAVQAGADLRVNGEPVEPVNGTFKRRVDLDEGDFHVTVTATDMAGNMMTKVRLIHVDWTAPELIIVLPETSEVYIRDSTIRISGDVNDATIDHVMVNDESIPISGRLDKLFTVLEGTTEFVVTVVDAAGNGVSEKIVVIRDLTPPTYESEITALGGEIIYIEGNMYSTAPAVEVHLSLSEVSVITLGDGTVLPSGTEVRQRYDLEEGVNNLDIYIVDQAGNQAQTYSESVTVDTTAPTISIQSPVPGYRTKEEIATIHGYSEVGSNLTLNGETVNLRAGGEFTHIVALVAGRNEFILEAVDPMGNSNTTSISVLRESDVTTDDGGSTGSTVTGFVMGLVVGIVVMMAVMYVRSRGGPEVEAGHELPGDMAPQEPGPPADEEGGWEEY